MPIDALGKKKGYCAVTYSIPEHAAIALKALTGKLRLKMMTLDIRLTCR